jgi:hypothetical protein
LDCLKPDSISISLKICYFPNSKNNIYHDSLKSQLSILVKPFVLYFQPDGNKLDGEFIKNLQEKYHKCFMRYIINYKCSLHNTFDVGTQYLIFNQLPSDSNFHSKSANIFEQNKETCGVILCLSKYFLISRPI